MRNERPSIMEVLWCMAYITRRHLIMAVLTVPAGIAFAALCLMVGLWFAHHVWESVPPLGYVASLAVAASWWSVNAGTRAIIAVIPKRRVARMSGADGTEGVNYTGWNQPLTVTLTHTTNEYLRYDLPLRGLLMVHEMRTDDYAQRGQVTFQRLTSTGQPVSAPVHVDDARFTYDFPPTRSA